MNLLDRFKKHSLGSQNQISDFLARITSAGDFQRITGFDCILNSWSNCLMTPLGTYLNDPSYGSEIHKYIFKPLDDETRDNIKSELQYRLTQYDDRAKIKSINIYPNRAQKSMDVDITVQRNDETQKLTISLDKRMLFNVITNEE